MDGYEIPKSPLIDQVEKKACESNAKEKNTILCALSNSEFVKILHCKIAKEVWSKLHNIYEGNIKVK